MKIQSFLPVFPGFYETIFEPDLTPHIDDGKTSDNYEWDYSEYWPRVASACCGFIERELATGKYGNSPKLEMEVEFKGVGSPKEYNFTNDTINVEYTLSETIYKAIINYLRENDKEFREFIKEHCTSCEGFESYYSNNHYSWYIMLEDEQELMQVFGTVLNFICENENILSDDMHSGVVHEMYIEGELQENELLEFTIPDWAKCALINGDPFEAGTDEQNAEDQQKLSVFTKDCIEKYGHANFTTGKKSEVKSFLPTNDIDNLGSDCVTLYLLNKKS